MTLKTILTCLTTEQHTPAILGAAIPLARRHGAHLIGLHTLEALEIYPGIAMHVTDEMFKAFNAEQKHAAEGIKAAFETRTRGEDFVSEYRLLQAQSNSASERMIESARAADLVIMAHEDREVDRYDQRRVQSAVIRHSGRPVIVVPNGYEGPEIGNRILVGWSDTREAARAAHDALALARPGAEITLLRVQPHGGDALRDADLLDLSAALARHGASVDVRHVDGSGADGIAQALLQTGFEMGADLIATGAFGHSSAYDFVVGATTSALLKSANLPVLFSK
ncbi:universal stress protein [Poseidonocella sedimentorum]|uniref:Nucleotide-binding universal stress protein, UspA family n=1 Tax=Poseidonocella sedimentorum TaxID=871652 RepID=A0A1I6DVH4_9RHOB|nr:universal stress protein [Poseidonocella sedimentorum]SFR09463.1 Nucleotide-binding universal stress protein, UspA family [Poseidonocella sedimentorum]